MAESKWLMDLERDTPLPEAARRVLSARMGGIAERLALALAEWDKDPEPVHQLRVATRRTGAALDVFSVCLPGRIFDQARRRLRRLRRAAGAARDADVFQQWVSARSRRAREEQRAGLGYLLGFASGQRAAAQQNLVRATRRKPRDWQAFLAEVLEAIEPPSTPQTLGELAQPHLSRLVADLESAAHRDLKEYEHLHQVRILGKQLRYAMEIFAGCHGSEFRERYYPAIEDMQEILGQANDAYVASQRLSAINVHLETSVPHAWQRLRAGLEGALKSHQRRLPACRRQFEAWWKHWLELNMVGHYELFVKIG